MRRVQRRLQFALGRGDNRRFAIPEGTTGAIVQATTEIGTWSTVVLNIVPTVNGVRGAFSSPRTITSSAPSASFTEDELAGVSELEVFHVGATVNADTFLTIELTTDTTPGPRTIQLDTSTLTPIDGFGGSFTL